jgi:hypothetical protein
MGKKNANTLNVNNMFASQPITNNNQPMNNIQQFLLSEQNNIQKIFSQFMTQMMPQVMPSMMQAFLQQVVNGNYNHMMEQSKS